MSPEQQAQFRLLKTLEEHPEFSQRDLAEAVGLSLGRTNFVIHALMDKGFIKIERFLNSDNKLSKTAYILTPAGIRHRVELTQSYIKRKLYEYQALKSELEALRRDAPEEFPNTKDTQD
ncbi:MarR family EPS-associated transcriptional regulator [Uliginosibacterium sediminicola]|uniref:MarR family EPS-associated transcriptional regulator n=1 Tax=Uliginosibacterium sediminicola TaxID=2024550 RepID=A0ABU9Z3T0_9RHOO